MEKFLNYIFIGFIFTFLLDYISNKYVDHPAFKDVPGWNWNARIMFILFWPLGAIIFIYMFICIWDNDWI